ncbi:ATP-dependent endonuclease [Methylococcaceae bacterium CS5]|nr:ATP-dependent endonuclease [Methylococcaceae bacterium CS5]
MSILVDKVRIAGFRGIAELEITLPRVTVLIGTNNSGKTSVIKAMQLALGDYSRYLAEEDFYIDADDNRIESILVDVRVVAMDLEGKGKPVLFDDEWVEHFGDKIRSEANGDQFLALRTECEQDRIKGGFSITRFALDRWPDYPNWKSEATKRKNQLRKRFDALPFISIDAQRDIHQELREKSSFIGKVLSSVEYDKADITKLEELVKAVNDEAVEKSQPLQDLKEHLEQLNQSFQGSGEAEITPFPKKIRDLSKQFTVHFGDQANNSFSMEYHGMGTRSWASMLTVKAFVELTGKNHQEEEKPFFPLIAAEEPEAHLHPNAQRTLYEQLSNSQGQVIVSTHSPYLAAMIDIKDIRSLIRYEGRVRVNSLTAKMNPEDINIIQREVMRFRGEILFSRAVILFEGVTEEQIVPAMFEHYYGCSAFSKGINCISVAGNNYAPFIKMGCSLGVPIYVVSDNDRDGDIKTNVEAHIENIKQDTGLELGDDVFSISFLNLGNDIEAELINSLALREEIIESLVLKETKGTSNSHYLAAKTTKIEALDDESLLEKMRASKASYAGFLADVITRNPQNRVKGDLVPEAFKEAFKKIEEWVKL